MRVLIWLSLSCLNPFTTDRRLDWILIIYFSTTTTRSQDSPAFCTLHPGWTFNGHWKMETLTRMIHYVALGGPMFAMQSTYIGCVYSVYCIYLQIICDMLARCHYWLSLMLRLYHRCARPVRTSLHSQLHVPLRCPLQWRMCEIFVWILMTPTQMLRPKSSAWRYHEISWGCMNEVSWSTLLCFCTALLFFQFLGCVLGVQHETAGKEEVASQVARV